MTVARVETGVNLPLDRSTTRAINLLAQALVTCAAALSCSTAAADSAAELELGAVADRAVSGNPATHLGPSVAIEFTPIEHWLELEAGISRFQIEGASEWDAEFSFKKPFDVSPSFEFMIGFGPTWTHTNAPLERADSFGAELLLDPQFWRNRRWGWFIEPSYSVDFNHGSDRSVAITAGALVALF